MLKGALDCAVSSLESKWTWDLRLWGQGTALLTYKTALERNWAKIDLCRRINFLPYFFKSGHFICECLIRINYGN